jgi:hypothetical protein
MDGEGLQNFGLCSALTANEEEGFLKPVMKQGFCLPHYKKQWTPWTFLSICVFVGLCISLFARVLVCPLDCLSVIF